MKSFKIILGLTAVILASFLFIPENNTPIDFNSVYKAHQNLLKPENHGTLND